MGVKISMVFVFMALEADIPSLCIWPADEKVLSPFQPGTAPMKAMTGKALHFLIIKEKKLFH